MPVAEYGNPNPQTIGLNKIVIGENYAIVISTNGGLWRYLVGDTIQFTSTYPFKIKVSGRLKQYINAFGEEVIAENADKAIAIASEKTGLLVNDYTAAPIYFGDNNKGAHEWLIEFDEMPVSTDQFAYELDTALKTLNSDYEAKRFKDIALGLPVVQALHKGVFYEWLKQKGKLGGQHKIPRLNNERTILEEVKAIIKIYK